MHEVRSAIKHWEKEVVKRKSQIESAENNLKELFQIQKQLRQEAAENKKHAKQVPGKWRDKVVH